MENQKILGQRENQNKEKKGTGKHLDNDENKCMNMAPRRGKLARTEFLLKKLWGNIVQ
ncbi:hypothetical protein [[Eubacterium] cellulosolvens]